MTRPTVLIIGISSDIGRALAEMYWEGGYQVVGTYRNPDALHDLPPDCQDDMYSYRIDIRDRRGAKLLAEQFDRLPLKWDLLISCVGTQLPIGKFFSVDFEEWAESVHVNAIDQLRMVHHLYPYRAENASVVFFAGGGTNGPMPNYSAYCASKIMLIKMCELLDNESEDLNCFIIGPGWVQTKIHQQTVANPELAGDNYLRTKQHLESDFGWTSMDEIFEHINWGVQEGRSVVGGRNFSTVSDRWRADADKDLLRSHLTLDEDMYKLRRQGNCETSESEVLVALGSLRKRLKDTHVGGRQAKP